MREIENLFKEGLFEDIAKRAEKFAKSDDFRVLEMVGRSFLKLNRFKEAGLYFQKALKLNPSSFVSLFNLAGINFMFGDFKESIKLFEKALAISPLNFEIYYNIGVVYQEMNLFKKAKRYYMKALKLNPEDISSLYNLSLIFLTQGDYQKGFDYYRYRYHPKLKNRQTNIISYEKLLKKGDDFKDKRIFIYREQGLGDMIQFIRFLPLFSKKASKITLSMPKPLLRLFKYNFGSLNVSFEEEMADFDYHFPLMEAAFILNLQKENIPFRDSYLKVDLKDSLEYKKRFIKDSSKLKVGIVWRTNLLDSEDIVTKIRSKSKREIPLDQFVKYLDFKDIELFSLQKNETKEEKQFLKSKNIVSLDDTLKDFYDTALAIDNLDMVVSIDTSVVHLSGAMGKKTFVPLPFNNDWRWGEGEGRSNWYESVSLFRQDENRDWNKPLGEIRDKLEEILKR